MPTILYIRGEPGSGKHTVAQLVHQQRPYWKVFWIHDLDNIATIVGDHRVPRLMDDVCEAVLRHLMADRHNIVFVRPSRDRATVEAVHDLAAVNGYRFELVSLTASYKTLLNRTRERPDTHSNRYRIRTKDMLDEYLSRAPMDKVDAGNIINTDNTTPQEVADAINKILDATTIESV